jgi:hypothetical protein
MELVGEVPWVAVGGKESANLRERTLNIMGFFED